MPVRSPRRLAMTFAALAVFPLAAHAQTGPSLAVAGVTLGLEQPAVEAALRQRGASMKLAKTQTLTINNLPQTRFTSHLYDQEFLAQGRQESYGFLFTAPPSKSRAWGAGFMAHYATSGGGSSSDAPSLTNSLATLSQRYGAPSSEIGGSNNRELWWLWTNQGALLPKGSPAVVQCQNRAPSVMMSQIVMESVTEGNPAGGDATPLATFIKAGCGYAVHVSMNATAGVLTQIHISAIDAVLAYKAFIETNTFVTGLDASREKARLNEANKAKPSF